MSEQERAEGEGAAIAIPGPELSGSSPTGLRRYHIGLSPEQVLERLTEQPGVRAYDAHSLPDFGGLIPDSEFTLELGAGWGRSPALERGRSRSPATEVQEFRLHCGPPAARGQSGTGMLRLLYMVGRLTPTREGTQVELRFAWRRPRWALQRWVGFLALASLGLLWVLIGPGVLAKKALLYGLLLAVIGPVAVHDLRRDQRMHEQRLALLNLMEHVLGPVEIAQGHPDEPYRKRLRPGDEPEDDFEEDDEDDEVPTSRTASADQTSTTPEKT